MVDVEGREFKPEFVPQALEEVEQNDGIEAARKSGDEPPPTCQVRNEGRADVGKQPSGRLLP
jgi:hypothetical protein